MVLPLIHTCALSVCMCASQPLVGLVPRGEWPASACCHSYYLGRHCIWSYLSFTHVHYPCACVPLSSLSSEVSGQQRPAATLTTWAGTTYGPTSHSHMCTIRVHGCRQIPRPPRGPRCRGVRPARCIVPHGMGHTTVAPPLSLPEA